VTIEHRGGEKVELQLSSNLTEDTQNNVDVFPGDTIIVSRAGIVYVVGDVQHPSGFMMEDSAISVLKALALAGGSTRTSALNKTKSCGRRRLESRKFPSTSRKCFMPRRRMWPW